MIISPGEGSDSQDRVRMLRSAATPESLTELRERRRQIVAGLMEEAGITEPDTAIQQVTESPATMPVLRIIRNGQTE